MRLLAASSRTTHSCTLAVLWVLYTLAMSTSSRVCAQDKHYAIVIHGGAGGDPNAWSEEYRQQRLAGLESALDVGVELLEGGATALDVVEQVVRGMEDDETFNAGRGCVLNEQGEHELDASIMDGKELRCGAVGGVRATKNPISLARKVMTETRHVLLVGSGADEFSLSVGAEQAPPEYFRTPRQQANLKKWKAKQSVSLKQSISPKQSISRKSISRKSISPQQSGELYFGTVGCVVVDQHGNLAAATSTGGLMGKRWGRVGDSPIIGAGNYADNQTCAVSGTGVGEEFIRHNIARDVSARMAYANQSLKEAAKATIAVLPEQAGGIIAVDAKGNMVMEFNTPGMSRAFADSKGLRGIKLGRE